MNKEAASPFDAILGVKVPSKLHEAGTRDGKGRFLAGPPKETRAKRIATLKSRTKGQEQTPYMNFSGRINWLNRMLSQLSVPAYVAELRRHPARAQVMPQDELRFRALEERALAICREANELAAEIAKWNKTKRKRKV
jgi:hypothetical protein